MSWTPLALLILALLVIAVGLIYKIHRFIKVLMGDVDKLQAKIIKMGKERNKELLFFREKIKSLKEQSLN